MSQYKAEKREKKKKKRTKNYPVHGKRLFNLLEHICNRQKRK